MKLHTFLNFGGNCEPALKFYEQHLGGKIVMLMLREEQAGGEQAQPLTWPRWEKTVQYAIRDVGETQLMASDVSPDRFQPMRSAYLSLTVESAEEADRVCSRLAEGGEVLMPVEETFFAQRWVRAGQKFSPTGDDKRDLLDMRHMSHLTCDTCRRTPVNSPGASARSSTPSSPWETRPRPSRSAPG